MNKLVMSIAVLTMLFLIGNYIISPTANLSESQWQSSSETVSLQSTTITSLPGNETNKTASHVSNNNENSSKRSDTLLQKRAPSNLFIENGVSSEEQSPKQRLASVLLDYPRDYHPVFEWLGGFDKELVDAHLRVKDDQATKQSNGTNVALETMLADFIFAHEQISYLEIERLSCGQASCQVYGEELSTGTWNTILAEVQEQEWWPFSKEISRNGVSDSNQIVFITILSK